MPSDRQVTWSKLRVVIVIVCALSILSVLFYLLTAGTLLEEKVRLYVFISDATGVDTHSPVRVDGIDVGKVRSVGLSGSTEPNRVVRVVIWVEKDYLHNIPDDSYAQISADNLLGDKFVDITSGKHSTPIQPNSEIRFQPPQDILKTLDIGQFQRQLKVMDAMLTEIEAGRGQVGQLVIGEQLYDEVGKRLADLERAITSAVSTTGAFGEVLYSDAAYRKISQPLRELDESLARLQSGQGKMGQLLSDSAQYDEARSSIARFRAELENIRAGRNSVGQFLITDTLYNDAIRSVERMMGTVDRAATNPLLTSTEVYDSLNGLAREVGKTVKDFRQDPQKFLRLKVF